MRPMHATADSHVLIALAAASYISRDVGCGAIAHSLGPVEPMDIDSALDRLASRDLVRDAGRGRWRVTERGWAVLERRHSGACWENEVEQD